MIIYDFQADNVLFLFILLQCLNTVGLASGVTSNAHNDDGA